MPSTDFKELCSIEKLTHLSRTINPQFTFHRAGVNLLDMIHVCYLRCICHASQRGHPLLFQKSSNVPLLNPTSQTSSPGSETLAGCDPDGFTPWEQHPLFAKGFALIRLTGREVVCVHPGGGRLKPDWFLSDCPR